MSSSRLAADDANSCREYGFASLHNVNKPSSKRDDMPSFFMAETLKYLADGLGPGGMDILAEFEDFMLLLHM